MSALNSPNGFVLIYGSKGAVGKACTIQFKSHNWWIGCVDFWKTSPNEEDEVYIRSTHSITNPNDRKYEFEDINRIANLNILVDPNKDLARQEAEIIMYLSKALNGRKLDAIICLASGFVSGNASEDLTSQMNAMWKQNVWPAVISTSIAIGHLKEGGFLCLPGAKAALKGTPSMVGYGLTKAAVHHLTRSLALNNDALPKNTVCIGLLPVTIDSAINKDKNAPPSDVSEWTPTKYISDVLFKWSIGMERPETGNFVLFNTKNFITDICFLK